MSENNIKYIHPDSFATLLRLKVLKFRNQCILGWDHKEKLFGCLIKLEELYLYRTGANSIKIIKNVVPVHTNTNKTQSFICFTIIIIICMIFFINKTLFII